MQYAHARICSIFRKAESEGADLQPDTDIELLKLLKLEEEIDLIRTLDDSLNP